MTEDEKYLADEVEIKGTICRLNALHDEMQRVGESYMGNLQYAEAALFHGATDLVQQLLASIHERRSK